MNQQNILYEKEKPQHTYVCESLYVDESSPHQSNSRFHLSNLHSLLYFRNRLIPVSTREKYME